MTFVIKPPKYDEGGPDLILGDRRGPSVAILDQAASGMTSSAVLHDLECFLEQKPSLAACRLWRLLDVAQLIKLMLHDRGLGELSPVKLKG